MGGNKVINDGWPMMMISIFSKLWRGTAKLLELRPAWGDFASPIFYYISPQKALLLSSGKGKLNLSFSFLFYLFLNATLSLTFSSHISKNEWEVKPTPQFDYRRMRTKFYNILWDLGNLKIRGKFCNIFHLKILRIMFLNILYLRHPIHFIILPPMGPLSIYTKARALIKQKTFTTKPFIW